MKKLILLLPILIGTMSLHATTVIFSTTPVAYETRAVESSLGVPLPDGSLVRIGTFAQGFDFFNASLIDLETNFLEFGTARIDTYSIPQIFISRSGLLGGQVENTSINAGLFDDKQIFLWFYDAPETGTAEEHGLFTSDHASYVFPVSQGGSLASTTIDLRDINSALIAGTQINDYSLQLVGIVPEPTTVTLVFGGCGLLYVLLRRSRRGQL